MVETDEVKVELAKAREGACARQVAQAPPLSPEDVRLGEELFERLVLGKR